MAGDDRLLRAVLDAALEAIVTIDARGTILTCNPAAERIFGYERDEMLGRNVSMLMGEPESEEHDGFVRRYLASRQPRVIGIGRDVLGRRKDGSVVPLHLGITEIRVDGEPIFVGLLRDTSQEREGARRVTELHDSLAERNRKLQSLLYVASHDLRTPLVNIQGFSQELRASCDTLRGALEGIALPAETRREVERVLSEEIPEALGYILGGTAKMDTLLGGILRLSRLGRRALSLQPLDMNRILDELLVTMEFQIQQQNARVDVGPLPSCVGDPVQVGQVFGNLLDNALKYSAPDRTPAIRVSGERRDDEAVYRVADNGVGIPARHQDRIFEVFHRLDQSGVPGEGLGLTIAQRIVDRHHGHVSVDSSPGEGSTFVVRLPAVAEKLRPTASPARLAPSVHEDPTR